MSFETIRFEIEKGVAWVTLNRPKCLNAINDQMLKELSSVLIEVDKNNKIRCLVLAGEGRSFCSGQDLNDRNAPGDERIDLGETVGKGYNPFLRHFYNLEVPTIAAVNGFAAGAGANIALACDIVIAAEDAKFIQVYSNIGLMPDAGGSFILPRLVGMAKAKELTFSARSVKATEAVEMNMIARSVTAEDLINVVREMAEGLAVKPTYGLANTKKALHASYSNNLDAQLDLERDLVQKCGFSDDYVEGVSAFLEKRIPNFKGC